jgi:hypothetical protein
MRALTEWEKVDVKKMYESAWFKVMLSLVDEFKNDVMSEMLTMPLGDPETIAKLTGKQNYLLWVNKFIAKVKMSTTWVGKKND